MIRSLLKKLHNVKSRMIYKRISPFLYSSDNIIDIGSGAGSLTEIIRKSGKKVVPLDVKTYKWPRFSEPVFYDGRNIPYGDKTFSTGMLVTVLHHTDNPESILKEAARVSRELIVVETSYVNPLHKLITILVDTLVNLQLKWNWDSYHSDQAWKELFSTMGFSLVASKKCWDFYNFGIPFLHITYYLKIPR